MRATERRSAVRTPPGMGRGWIPGPAYSRTKPEYRFGGIRLGWSVTNTVRLLKYSLPNAVPCFECIGVTGSGRPEDC